MAEEPLLLWLRERAASGNEGQAGHHRFMLPVLSLLFAAELHKKVSVGARQQFSFDVRFAPAQHVGLDPLVKLVEIAIPDRPSAVVQLIILPVEAEERTKQRRIQKGH